MKTKVRAAITVTTTIIALAFASVSHAQLKEPPVPGTYYSAKDFEWSPPWPFNPHPELEVVEITPGIFIFDDTGIPDTPEQAEARQRRQEADALAKAIAAIRSWRQRHVRRQKRPTPCRGSLAAEEGGTGAAVAPAHPTGSADQPGEVASGRSGVAGVAPAGRCLRRRAARQRACLG